MKSPERLRAFFLTATLLAGASLRAISQVEAPLKEDNPPYDVDAISFASTFANQSRVDVYVQVPYQSLAFVKEDERYRATYEITIDIIDSVGKLVNEKLWTEEVRAETFDQSVSSQGYSLVERSFDVPPGEYSVVTFIRDNERRQNQRQEKKLKVSDFSTPKFSLSDIMLVSKLSKSGDRTTIVPCVSRNVGLVPDVFYIFFEAYDELPIDSVKFVIDILNEKKEKASHITETEKLSRGRNQVFLAIRNDSLPIGDYTVYVRAFAMPETSSAPTTHLASTGRTFVVHWKGLPISVKDIDLAIDECVYEAKDAEMAHMREAKTPEEKQRRFLEFWKKRDPNPNTPRNEKMEAYFTRVEYANKTFKHYLDGWRTDMGMVYIIFGPPSNVDRHPFDIDAKPYEIWNYYDLNHSFVFVDQTGFGDYRLTTPIWDVWQRPRD